MTAKEIKPRPEHPEPPSPALVAAGPQVAYASVAANAARNASIVRASKAGRSPAAIAADHRLSIKRIRQIVAAADGRELGRNDAFEYLSRRTRTSLHRNNWTTVQRVRDAYLALLLQVPDLGWKALQEVRRWLWLQTGDPQFGGRDAAWPTRPLP